MGDQPVQSMPIAGKITPLVQRQVEEEDEEETIQTELISPVRQVIQKLAELGEEEETAQSEKNSGLAPSVISKEELRRQPEEEEEPIQTKSIRDQFTPLVQRQAEPVEEEEEIQTKRFSGQIIPLVHRQIEEEEEEPIQTKRISTGQPTLQRQEEQEGKEEGQEEPIQAEPSANEVSPLIHRQTKVEEEETEADLQAKEVSAPRPTATRDLESRIHAQKGSGEPLPESTRAFFEPRFGADFSQVRVHTGSRTADTAESINAKAFTVGENISFGKGQYTPESQTGRRLLAHELTHVVQQSGGAFTQRVPLVSRQLIGEPMVQRDDEEFVDPNFAPVDPGFDDTADTGGDGGGEDAPGVPSDVPSGGGLEQEEENSDGTLGRDEEVINIPGFDVDEGGECFNLVPKETCAAEKAGAGPNTVPEEALGKLVDFAIKGGVLGWGLGKLISLAGRGALWAWKKIPLSARAYAINKAIGYALNGTDFIPNFALRGNIMARWLHAGIRGYLKALLEEDDATKVYAFEKYLTIILGGDESFSIGYAKGLLCGFFVSGLVGIIQMIIDLICLVGKIPKFIESFRRFFGAFPEEMEKAAQAIKEFDAAMTAALPGALDQVLEVISDPVKIAGLVETVAASGAASAEKMGAAVAEKLLAMAREPSKGLGFKVGQATGVVLFEVVLGLLTAGGGAAVSAVKISAKVGLKVIASIGKNILGAIHFLKPWFLMFKNFAVSVGTYLTKGFRLAAGKLGKVFDRIEEFFAAILKRCRPGSVKCKVKKPKKPKRPKKPKKPGKDLAVISKYKVRVKTKTMPYRIKGISHFDLSIILSRERRVGRARRVILSAPVRKSRRGQYKVTAITTLGPKKIVTIRRLKTGKKQSEAIPMNWYKPLRNYPQRLALTPNPARWRGGRTVPNINSITMLGKNEIEVPPTQFRSFPLARTGTRGGKTVKVITVGVALPFRPFKGKPMKRTRSKGTKRPLQGRYRNLLKNYQYAGLATEEIDHVQDIGWGGASMDNLRNLWPLESTRNRAGNESYTQDVTYQSANRRRVGKPTRMIGKWFKIR